MRVEDPVTAENLRPGALQASERFFLGRVLAIIRSGCSSAPDLPARPGIIVQQNDLATLLGSRSRSGHTRRACADDEHLGLRHRAVSTVMPSAHSIWQAGRCATPSTTARHSKQMPIPHNAVRGSPLTEILQGALACSIAAATVVPLLTRISFPLIHRRISGTDRLRPQAEARRQKRRRIDRGFAA
jgi:hypothetical protein